MVSNVLMHALLHTFLYHEQNSSIDEYSTSSIHMRQDDHSVQVQLQLLLHLQMHLSSTFLRLESSEMSKTSKIQTWVIHTIFRVHFIRVRQRRIEEGDTMISYSSQMK